MQKLTTRTYTVKAVMFKYIRLKEYLKVSTGIYLIKKKLLNLVMILQRVTLVNYLLSSVMRLMKYLSALVQSQLCLNLENPLVQPAVNYRSPTYGLIKKYLGLLPNLKNYQQQCCPVIKQYVQCSGLFLIVDSISNLTKKTFSYHTNICDQPISQQPQSCIPRSLSFSWGYWLSYWRPIALVQVIWFMDHGRW